MFKPPSLQKDITLIWSQDPALLLPEDPAERSRAIAHAQRTGDWPIAEGQQPTLFTFKNLSRSDLDWIATERQNSSEHGGQPLAPVAADGLVLRAALKSIENFGTYKVEVTKIGNRVVASKKTLDIICAGADEAALALGLEGQGGSSLVFEFVSHLVSRATNALDPLS